MFYVIHSISQFVPDLWTLESVRLFVSNIPHEKPSLEPSSLGLKGPIRSSLQSGSESTGAAETATDKKGHLLKTPYYFVTRTDPLRSYKEVTRVAKTLERLSESHFKEMTNTDGSYLKQRTLRL